MLSEQEAKKALELIRLEHELLPYGFSDGKYGNMAYEAVAWNGVQDIVAFGFNIFVDERLIATACAFKDGRFVVDMMLGQWLAPEELVSREYKSVKRKLWIENDARL